VTENKQTFEKEIDGVRYETSIFTGSRALKILVRVFRIIGKPIGAALEGNDGGKLSLSNLNIDIGLAIKAIADNADSEVFEPLIKDIIASTLRNGVKINFDLDFSGKMGHLFRVIAFVLQSNYSDFFDGISSVTE